MLVKQFPLLAGVSLLASIGLIATAPAQAQSLGTQSKVYLMEGHPMLGMLKEMDPEAVAIGRVVGRSGSILSIKFIEPESVTVGDREYTAVTLNQPNWHTVEGNDVVLAYKDGAWEYIGDGACSMAWITRLDLKAAPEVQAIDWGESQPVAIPPSPEPRVSAPEPAPEPAPIPGLW